VAQNIRKKRRIVEETLERRTRTNCERHRSTYFLGGARVSTWQPLLICSAPQGSSHIYRRAYRRPVRQCWRVVVHCHENIFYKTIT
jgi:hypothetical protein